MKNLTHLALAYLAALVLLTASAFTQVNFMSNGGDVTTKTDGTLLITARAASIQGIPVVGHFQIDLPNTIISGNLQDGAVFAAGGIFELIVSSPVPYTYTGTIAANSQWQAANFDNPYYSYDYFWTVVSAQGNASCELQGNTLTAAWSGSMTIDQALVCNTDAIQPETKK
jgi:hypothetical protein